MSWTTQLSRSPAVCMPTRPSMRPMPAMSHWVKWMHRYGMTVSDHCILCGYGKLTD